MGVLATVGSGLRSESSDITGMRTPRRLDFLPLVENQPPTSSNTEQPHSSSDAAASTRQRLRLRDFIYFAAGAAGLAGASAGAFGGASGAAPDWGGWGAASAGTLP